MSTTRILSNIDRALGHGKHRLHLVQVWPHYAAADLTAQTLQVFYLVGCLPEHKVTVSTHAI